MNERFDRRSMRILDSVLAAIFTVLTVVLVLAMVHDSSFFTWAFERHHNVLSWYVRPLFLVPFCVSAYRRTLAGMAATLFLLATSMFWFPVPSVQEPSVAEFLQVEMAYLTSNWTSGKVLATSLVPLTLLVLAAALWARNLRLGLSVLVLIAVMKMIWSVHAAGRAGTSIFAPALLGLLLCVLLIGWSLRAKDTGVHDTSDD